MGQMRLFIGLVSYEKIAVVPFALTHELAEELLSEEREEL